MATKSLVLCSILLKAPILLPPAGERSATGKATGPRLARVVRRVPALPGATGTHSAMPGPGSTRELATAHSAPACESGPVEVSNAADDTGVRQSTGNGASGAEECLQSPVVPPLPFPC